MPSDEADWSSGADLGRMLALLDPKEGDRKLRLFAVACWRRAWGRLADPALQELIDTAERYADRAAGYGELRAASQRAGVGSRPESPWNARWAAQAVAAVNAASYRSSVESYALAARLAADAAPFPDDEVAAQRRLLHDLFGDPFRETAAAPGWLTWYGGAVRKMAQAVYDARRFGDLPVLADALEDAGCADADILAHCRAGGEHVRGCWVVDLLLGKA
jgi:hypothetical protein